MAKSIQLGEGGYNLRDLTTNAATCIWYRMAYEFCSPDTSYRWWMQITAAGRISDPLPCVVDDFGTLVQVSA